MKVCKNRTLVMLLLIIVFIFTLSSCVPTGGYLLEISEVSYFNGIVFFTLMPAYKWLDLNDITLIRLEDETEIAFDTLRYNVDGIHTNYFLFNEEDGWYLENGDYLLQFSKPGFLFIHRDALKEPNIVLLRIKDNF